MVIEGGKFLTFLLDEEVYGIPIGKVKEIVGMLDITHIPRAQGYIKGVVNLRGKIVPIVDLRLKFGMEARPYNDRTCILVVQVELNGTHRLVGMTVDSAADVLNIQAEDIDPPPKPEAQTEGGFLLGLAKVKGQVILLLNIDKILNKTEITYIRREFQSSVSSSRKSDV